MAQLSDTQTADRHGTVMPATHPLQPAERGADVGHQQLGLLEQGEVPDV
jgi:hypothetical protein